MADPGGGSPSAQDSAATTRAGWGEARNILAVRLDNIGDVVMLGPALRAVKEASPRARITLLGTPGGSAGAALLPWVDDVITWRPLWQELGDPGRHDPRRDRALIEEIAGRGFDAALVFTSFSQTPHVPGYVCYLAGIPLRAGESKEFGGATLTTELRGAPDELHQVERNLRLIEHLGFPVRDRRLEIAIGEEARAAVPGLLARAGLDPEARFVLFHPGASAVARRYPAERAGEAARLLAERGWPILITGVEQEAETVATVAAAAPAAGVLVGGTSLPEYAALVERATAVVCGNTLPLHLADAVGTPLVALYAGTDEVEQWRSREVPSRILRRATACTPCYRFTCPIGQPCLDIPPEEVVAAVAEVAGEPSPVIHGAKSAGVAGEGDGGAEATGSDPASGSERPRDGADLVPAVLDTEPRRIAIFRALFLGDLICATPALRAVRRRFPYAEITLIGLPWAEDLLRRMPSLDRLEAFPGYPGIAEAPYDAERTAAFLVKARGTGYDLAIQLHGDGRSSNGFVSELGAWQTLGYRLEGDDRLDIGLAWVPQEHEVRRWARLVTELGGPVDDLHLDFPTDADEWTRAAALLSAAPEGSGPLIGLHPGAKDAARRWPPERFAAVGDALVERYGARVVVTGAPGEREIAAAVRRAMRAPALNLAGATDLGTFAAVIARLDLLVTNDTGASHLAAASRTRSVVLFGPTRPERWAPLDVDRHRVIDAMALEGAPDDAAAALAGLPVETVLTACEEALGAMPGDWEVMPVIVRVPGTPASGVNSKSAEHGVEA